MPQTITVPVSDPAHPSHRSWLEILLTSLRLAAQIGPAVVAVVDPGDANLANKLGAITSQTLDGIAADPNGGA